MTRGLTSRRFAARDAGSCSIAINFNTVFFGARLNRTKWHSELKVDGRSPPLNVPVQLSMFLEGDVLRSILANAVEYLYRIELSYRREATWEVRDTPPGSLFTVLLALADRIV